MCSKLAVLIFAGAVAVGAQDASFDPHSSIQINLPPDSPVTLLKSDIGESRATPRGSAMVIDLHMSLSLRNSGARNIRGVTLLVTTQEMTPGGKASVAVPSLNVAPGQAFPIRIDLRLLRPLQAGGGPLVQVGLDGVLFDGFGFYGQNRLNSRRAMTVWEMEAERDRRHFRYVFAASGAEGLRREMLDSLTRQAERPRIDVRVSRGGPAVNSAAANERMEQFAFLKIPDSPIEAVDGFAAVAGNEARTPRIRVVNRSPRPVRYLEIGWIVKDTEGHEFLAGSVPASEGDLLLPPGQTGRALQDTALRFSRNAGEPVSIASMTGFVSQVEFADGRVWVPNRAALQSSGLLRVVVPSPEEQRLVDLYRTKGLNAVIEELRKF
ncbi:MAG: hypothetical protein LAP39_22495 [Acidobacteriia bacterium]|nr:hypothetical protein [Terriglobia bacterium]